MFTIQNIGIGTYGYFLAITIFFIGIQAFLFQSQNIGNNGNYKSRGNIIMIIISQELILFSIGILLINISVGLDDLVGSYLTLLLLPLAGAESAVALAFQVAYYPIRGSINIT